MATLRPEGLCQLNQTHDRPNCSAVPQPTASPRCPCSYTYIDLNYIEPFATGTFSYIPCTYLLVITLRLKQFFFSFFAIISIHVTFSISNPGYYIIKMTPTQ